MKLPPSDTPLSDRLHALIEGLELIVLHELEALGGETGWQEFNAPHIRVRRAIDDLRPLEVRLRQLEGHGGTPIP